MPLDLTAKAEASFTGFPRWSRTRPRTVRPFFSRITVSILAFPAGGASLRTGWGT